MDYIVAKPYGVEEKASIRDHDEIRNIYLKLISDTSCVLNSFHKTTYSDRYWEIVLGHWLMEYITVVFNRYKAIVNVLENYNIEGVSLLNFENNKVSFSDGLDFKHNVSGDSLNDFLYSKILDGLNVGQINFELFNNTSKSLEVNSNKAAVGVYANLREFFFTRIAPRFVKENDALIIKSYLPFKDEFILQIYLGQFPQDWSSYQKRYKFEANLCSRSELSVNLNDCMGVEFYIRKLLFDVIPTCHIEGYNNLVNITKQLRWPINPKFVFTSNSFQFDDIFKVWTASKVENGCPYYVGQHGSDYGARRTFENYVEFNTCDRFIAWGEWAKEYNFNNCSKKVVPGFNFKIATGFRSYIENKTTKINNKGGLLLIQRGPGYRLGPQDNYFEHKIYQKEMFELVRQLPLSIKERVTVRLHKGSKIHNTSDEYLWMKQKSIASVDMYQDSIFSKIKNSRISIFSYDSTGVLEMLLLNVPIICFWHIGPYDDDMLLPYAKPYYNLLKEAEILAETPKEASEYISKHWDNVDAWWQSNKVQSARKIFCNQFSKGEKKPMKALKRILSIV
jgi:putative transferase (TIGR04331 family)